MRRRWRLAAVAAPALGALWLGWRACAPAPEAADLRTAKAVRGDLEITAESSGTVDADRRVEVKSRASGEVVEVTVKAGDPVRAGDLLVRLDPTDEERRVEEARAAEVAARSRMAQAEAGLASARADLADARGRLERRAAALRRGLVSHEEHAAAATAAEVAEQAVRQREAEVRAAEADAARAALAVDEALRRLEETVIKAPADGTVLDVEVEVGSIVSSGITNVGGGTALLTLADLGRLYVVVKLDEAQVGSVKAGQEARIRVDAYPEKVFRGRVERVTPLGASEANIVTFDVEVRVTDPEAGLLLPGMSTDVAIVTERHEGVLLVPSAAVRRSAPPPHHAGETGPARRRPAAYVLLASGERRTVEVGATNGILTIVESGLAEGDEVVVSSLPAGAEEEGGPSNLRRGMWMLRRGR